VRDYLHLLSGRDWRAADLDALRWENGRLTARFVLPVYAGPIESAAPIERLDWRRARDLSQLLGATDISAVQVTRVAFEDEPLIEGLVVGAAARKELAGKVGEARLRTSPSGACRAFAITTRERVLETPPLCRAEAEPVAGRVVVRGTGGLTMHFRAIDLANLFFALHDVTGESFIVDPDVKGSVDVEVENASLDAVLAAICTLNLVITDGPLRRVSRPNAAAPQSGDYTGSGISTVFDGGDVRSILCLYETITGLKFYASPELRVKATVVVHERPWDEVLEALLAGARLRYTIDGTRVLVGEKATGNACDPLPWVFSDLRPNLEQLAAADFTLAGTGGAKAYVYGPWRRIMILEPGTRVFDGVVQSIAPSRVRFALDGGGLRQ
jgi:hypothetical protein